MKLGTQLLMSKMGGNAANDTNAIQNALGSLVGLDVRSLLSGLQSGGLGDVAKSWLGDGENAPISSEQIKSVVDNNKLSQLASALGTDEGSALSVLTRSHATNGRQSQ